MSITNWGELVKAVDDDQTILEAIAELIAEHNADPDAHLGENGSLNSHKASEIIDHLAASIVADKFLDHIVAPRHYDMSKFILDFSLESIDAFYQRITGSGGQILLECPGLLRIEAGTPSGSYSSLEAISSLQDSDEWQELVFQCKLWDNSEDCDIMAFASSATPFSTPLHGIGFYWSYTDSKLYAYIEKPTTPIKVDLDLGRHLNGDLLRVEVDHALHVARFYINGILATTQSLVDTTWGGSDAYFQIAAQRKTGVVSSLVWVANILYYQNM